MAACDVGLPLPSPPPAPCGGRTRPSRTARCRARPARAAFPAPPANRRRRPSGSAGCAGSRRGCRRRARADSRLPSAAGCSRSARPPRTGPFRRSCAFRAPRGRPRPRSWDRPPPAGGPRRSPALSLPMASPTRRWISWSWRRVSISACLEADHFARHVLGGTAYSGSGSSSAFSSRTGPADDARRGADPLELELPLGLHGGGLLNPRRISVRTGPPGGERGGRVGRPWRGSSAWRRGCPPGSAGP
jgi:hypothetical protein